MQAFKLVAAVGTCAFNRKIANKPSSEFFPNLIPARKQYSTLILAEKMTITLIAHLTEGSINHCIAVSRLDSVPHMAEKITINNDK